MKRAPTWVLAAVLTAVLFAVPWEFCMDGKAHGFPFPWSHPGHDEPGEHLVRALGPLGDVVDAPNLLKSLALWVAGLAALTRFGRRLR